MTTTTNCLAITILIALSSVPVSGSLVESWSGGIECYHVEDCVDGYEFTVGGSDLLVTALGFLDAESDGLNTSHPVGVWDIGGQLQGQTTVQAGTASRLAGIFRYEDVFAPFTLAANTTYVIGGWRSQASMDWGLGMISSLTLGDGIAEAGAVPRYGASPALAFPAGTVPAHAIGYLDQNMEYQVVPEPATGCLFMVGLATLMAIGPVRYAKRIKGVMNNGRSIT